MSKTGDLTEFAELMEDLGWTLQDLYNSTRTQRSDEINENAGVVLAYLRLKRDMRKLGK